MAEKMVDGTFRLKGQRLETLTREGGASNRHRVSMRAGVSYPTVVKYFEIPSRVASIHLPSLAGILIGAAGLTPEEALSLPLGEIFEYVSNGEL